VDFASGRIGKGMVLNRGATRPLEPGSAGASSCRRRDRLTRGTGDGDCPATKRHTGNPEGKKTFVPRGQNCQSFGMNYLPRNRRTAGLRGSARLQHPPNRSYVNPNCDSEPIRTRGSIRPHGATLIGDAATGVKDDGIVGKTLGDSIGGTAARHRRNAAAKASGSRFAGALRAVKSSGAS
jgi:hypothetical protein